MFEKILLPLDISELAEGAVPYAVELALRLGSELILFHACGPEHQQFRYQHETYLARVGEDLRQRLTEAQPGQPRVNTAIETEPGGAAEAISGFATKSGVGLIIMTTGGESGRKTGGIGKVADGVSRTVSAPVMLIRTGSPRHAQGEWLINRIVVPLDGSESSKLALPVAEELAVRCGVAVVLFQMARIAYPVGGERAPFVDYERLTRDELTAVQNRITELERQLSGKGLNVTSRVTSGFDAAQEITTVGKQTGADLVVMSTHGRSGFRRRLFGSVAERVMRDGDRPLLLVTAKVG